MSYANALILCSVSALIYLMKAHKSQMYVLIDCISDF